MGHSNTKCYHQQLRRARVKYLEGSGVFLRLFLLQKKTTGVCGISKMLLFLMFGHESWTLPSPKILRWRPGCHGFSELLGRWGEVLQVLPALKPHAFFSIIFPYFFPPTAEQFSGNSWVEISLHAFFSFLQPRRTAIKTKQKINKLPKKRPCGTSILYRRDILPSYSEIGGLYRILATAALSGKSSLKQPLHRRVQDFLLLIFIVGKRSIF